MSKAYAGIGSRETPTAMQELMVLIGSTLAKRGFTLRSGAADGADIAFETGAKLAGGPTEIYLPWAGFNNHLHTPCFPGPDAFDLAAEYHPNWASLSQGAMKLMARNSYQVLGEHLNDPVKMVICWTPRGRGSGGTGQAIRIAQAYKIPVFDLGNAQALQEVKQNLGL